MASATRFTSEEFIGTEQTTVAFTDGHPAVGAWRFAGTGPMGDYVLVHQDGTLIRLNPAFGVGVGVWRATGELTGEGVAIFLDTDDSVTAVAPGTKTERITVEANATGATLAASFAQADGEPTGDRAEGVTGTRLTVESMTGTPAAATPVAAEGHPLLGVWMRIDPASCPTCYFVNHPDGTSIHLSSWGGFGVGVWQPTGERTGERVTVYYDLDLTDAVVPGELTIRVAIEVDATGDTVSAAGLGTGEQLDESAPDCPCAIEIVATETRQTLESLSEARPPAP
jgi:hypothetical protein